MYVKKPIEKILGSTELFSEVKKVYGGAGLHKLIDSELTMHVLEGTEINFERCPSLNNFFRIYATRGAIKDYKSNANTIRHRQEEFLYIPVSKNQTLRIEIITINHHGRH